MRRFVALLLAAALAACSDGGEAVEAPLPPTTAVPTPFAPTGTADVVRRWVAALAGGELTVAHGLLTPAAQERVGGERGLRAARDERVRWSRWSEAASPSYDALPVSDGLAVVVLRGRFGEAPTVLDTVAVPVRAGDERWAVDAFGDVGPYVAEPEPGTEIGPEQSLALVVDIGVEATVFVDGQPADAMARTAAGEGRERVTFRPERTLRPGEHVVAAALVDADGEAAAIAVIYHVTG